MSVRVAMVTPLTPTPARAQSADARAPSSVQHLTAAMARGDEEAFRTFHETYFDRLLRYLFVVTRGDEQSAQDALQETFTRVVRHVRTFDSEEVFWSWLTVIARSAAGDAARKGRRYANLLARFASFWKTQHAPEGANERHLKNVDQLLSEALDGLDPQERLLIERKYFHRASIAELAIHLGATDKAVESRLARARRALRAELLRRLNHEA